MLGCLSRHTEPREGPRMSADAPIRYGMFIMPFHPTRPSRSAQCYDEDLELIVRAEELGFSEFWIGEHHTMKYENIVMPEIFIARALGETQTHPPGAGPGLPQAAPPGPRRLPAGVPRPSVQGPAEPLLRRRQRDRRPGAVRRRAEERRRDGRRGDRDDPEAVVVRPALRDRRQVLEDQARRRPSTTETGIGYIPKPLQQPHPPIAMPGMSRNSPSMKTAGAARPSAVRPLPDPGQRAGRHLEDLRGGRARGRPAAATAPTGRSPARSSWPTRPRRPQRRARTNSLGQNYEYIGRLFDKGLGRKIYKRDLAMSDADCNLDYLMSEQIIAGDVDEVLAPAAAADRGDRPVRHAGADELRLGRQGELAAQHGTVRPRADAGAEQGGGRRGGVEPLRSGDYASRADAEKSDSTTVAFSESSDTSASACHALAESVQRINRARAWRSPHPAERRRCAFRPGICPPGPSANLPLRRRAAGAPGSSWSGPGVLLAGASIGSGEWLFGPAVSAQYGGTLLWLAGLSIVFQVFCNLEMMRYAVYCGESIIVGYLRTWPGPRFWMVWYAVLDLAAIWPFNASNAAVPLAAAMLGPSAGRRIGVDRRVRDARVAIGQGAGLRDLSAGLRAADFRRHDLQDARARDDHQAGPRARLS